MLVDHEEIDQSLWERHQKKLDEVINSLTEDTNKEKVKDDNMEVAPMMETIKNMVNQGLSVILISHKLNEVLSVSDRIIVLRNGKKVGEKKTANADYKSIASMIVGKEILL